MSNREIAIKLLEDMPEHEIAYVISYIQGFQSAMRAKADAHPMSEREQAKQIIDRLPESKMGYILAYLRGVAADDAPCE